MAKVSFETVQSMANENNGSGNGVGFFSLKNDGDEAIVRIMHDSVADFDILTCHSAKVGDKFRKINCIRNPLDSVDNCPLCAKGEKIQQRFFVHMIQYEKDAQGQIISKPVVWERSAGEYGTKLKNMIAEYGPLSDCIFKVKRNGRAGDMGTTYELMFGNPSIYRADLYPKKPELFDGYSACGTVVIDKDFSALSQFASTGRFPESGSTSAVATPAPTNLDVVVDDSVSAPQNWGNPSTTGGYVPQGSSVTGERPNRRY